MAPISEHYSQSLSEIAADLADGRFEFNVGGFKREISGPKIIQIIKLMISGVSWTANGSKENSSFVDRDSQTLGCLYRPTLRDKDLGSVLITMLISSQMAREVLGVGSFVYQETNNDLVGVEPLTNPNAVYETLIQAEQTIRVGDEEKQIKFVDFPGKLIGGQGFGTTTQGWHEQRVGDVSLAAYTLAVLPVEVWQLIDAHQHTYVQIGEYLITKNRAIYFVRRVNYRTQDSFPKISIVDRGIGRTDLDTNQ